MTPEMEAALLRSASRRGIKRRLCCSECRGVLGPRRVIIPITCEHCGAVFQLCDAVAEDVQSSAPAC